MILNVPKGREPGGEGASGASGFITIPRHVSTFDTHLRLESVPDYKKVWRHACSLSDSEKSFSLAETKQMKMQLQCHILMLSSLIFKVHCHTK